MTIEARSERTMKFPGIWGKECLWWRSEPSGKCYGCCEVVYVRSTNWRHSEAGRERPLSTPACSRDLFQAQTMMWLQLHEQPPTRNIQGWTFSNSQPTVAVRNIGMMVSILRHHSLEKIKYCGTPSTLMWYFLLFDVPLVFLLFLWEWMLHLFSIYCATDFTVAFSPFSIVKPTQGRRLPAEGE